MTVYLMWAIVLLLLGLALVILEAFIPSGGILGALAALSVLGSIGLAFYSSPGHGGIVLTVAVVALPAAIILALKWWPNTPIGRRVLLQAPTEDEVRPKNTQRQGLLGKIGKVKSVMLPSGAVSIDGRSIDAVSEGMVIEEGEIVKVVDVSGGRVVVRRYDGELPTETTGQPGSDDDVMNQPLDSLGLEDFDDTQAS